MLKSEDIGLFYLDIRDSSGLNMGIITMGCHIVYKDLFAFADCLIHLLKIRFEDKL